MQEPYVEECRFRWYAMSPFQIQSFKQVSGTVHLVINIFINECTAGTENHCTDANENVLMKLI